MAESKEKQAKAPEVKQEAASSSASELSRFFEGMAQKRSHQGVFVQPVGSTGDNPFAPPPSSELSPQSTTPTTPSAPAPAEPSEPAAPKSPQPSTQK